MTENEQRLLTFNYCGHLDLFFAGKANRTEPGYTVSGVVVLPPDEAPPARLQPICYCDAAAARRGRSMPQATVWIPTFGEYIGLAFSDNILDAGGR